MRVGHAKLLILIPVGLVAISLLFSGGAAAIACPEKTGAMIVGEARSVQADKLLYCEYHFDVQPKQSDSASNAQEMVKYYDPNDQLIAEKVVDYRSGLLSPSVTQNDFRHGEVRVLELRDASSFFMSYRKPNIKEDVQQVLVKASPHLVVDAGFDNAVRQYWAQLSAGESVVFEFASPVHARTIGLRVRKSDKKTCGSAAYNKESQVCYRIGAANTVLSMFVKPLALIYSQETQRLMRFAGQVNITTAKGKTQSAVINYQYN